MRGKVPKRSRKRKRPVLDGIIANEEKKVIYLRVSPSLHEHIRDTFGPRKMCPGIIAVLEAFFAGDEC